jgi:hypothetical protein
MKKRVLSLALALVMVLSLLPSVFASEHTGTVLMSLTRTAATEADTGNRFNANSGVFAGQSFLTAWNNNQQITIGGTGRTPIVINNAAVNNNPAGGNGWRSVGSAAIDAGISVDTATAFQIEFRTSGYSDIRFSCRQKSTGSGPQFFALAYSLNPEGPFIPIPDSKTRNIQAEFEGSGITNHNEFADYDAVEAETFANFPLPADAANKDRVFLRVYMVDSTLTNRANGNTSINNIVISSGAVPISYDPTPDRDVQLVFSREGGAYSTGFNLTLSTAFEGGIIRWTRDGSDPTPPGTAPRPNAMTIPDSVTHDYTGAIPIADRSRGPSNRLADQRNVSWFFFPSDGSDPRETWYPPGVTRPQHLEPVAGMPNPPGGVNTPIYIADVIKAQVFDANGNPLSRIVSNTYMIGLPAVFNTFPIISVTGDPGHFFDDNTPTNLTEVGVTGGIFRNTLVRPSDPSNPTGHGNSVDMWSSRRNFTQRGSDWERPINMEFFEPRSGSPGQFDIAMNQRAGVRVHGGVSRYHPQKSMRFYASSSRDPDNPTFSHDLFAGEGFNMYGEPITEYRRFIARNFGTTWMACSMRDRLAQRLMRGTNVSVQDGRYAIMLLNGEFWGLCEIRERIDEHMLSSNFNLDSTNVAIMNNRGRRDDGEFDYPEDWIKLNEMYAWFAEGTTPGTTEVRDISCPELYAKAQSFIDVDNFIDYIIIQTFVVDHDWPQNNQRMWRYQTDAYPTPGSPTHPMDGRWRHTLIDLDFGFGLYDDEFTSIFFPDQPFGRDHLAGFNEFERLLNRDAFVNNTIFNDLQTREVVPLQRRIEMWEWSTLFFRTFVTNQEFNEKLITRYAELLNTNLHPDNIRGIAQGFRNQINGVVPTNHARWANCPYFVYLVNDWNELSGNSVWGRFLSFVDSSNGRAANMLDMLRGAGEHDDYFGVGERTWVNLNLQVNNAARGFIRLNDIELRPGSPGVNAQGVFTGQYLSDTVLTLEPVALRGFEFTGFTINGVNNPNSLIELPITANTTIVAQFEIAPSATVTVNNASTIGFNGVGTNDTGAGVYYGEEVVTIRAGDRPTQSFRSWTRDVGTQALSGNTNTATFTMPSLTHENANQHNHTFSANWDNAPTGIVTITSNPAAPVSGGIAPAAPDNAFKAGWNITVNAGTRGSDWAFAGWTTSTEGITLANPALRSTSFIMPDPAVNVDLKANWVHASTVVVNTAGGASSVDGAGTYEVGSTVIVRAGPRAGHTFTHWSVEGISPSALSNVNSPTVTFTKPANAVSLTANWMRNVSQGGYTLPVQIEGPRGSTARSSWHSGTGTFAIWAGNASAEMQSRNAGTHYISFGNTNNWLSSANWAIIEATADQIRVRDGTAAAQGPVNPINGTNAKLMTRDSGTGSLGSATNPLVVTWGNVLPNHTQIDTTGITNGGLNILLANAVVTPTATITVNQSHAGSNNNGAGIYAGGRVVGLDAGVHPQGLAFQGWTVTEGTAVITNANNRVAYIVLPAEPQNITIRADWGATGELAGAPSVAGTMRLGQTLTAGAGDLSPVPLGAITYQWQRATTIDGTYTNIGGATFTTYVPVIADLGRFIRVQAETANTSGSRYSVPTAAITTNLGGSVTIPTDVSVNEIISITNNLTPSGIGGLIYQWQIADTAYGSFTDISTNGNAATYTPKSNDESRFIRARVTSAYGSGEVVYSNPTNAVMKGGRQATSPLLINQIYGQGDPGENGVSHGFIELYNPSDDRIYLGNYSVQLQMNPFDGREPNANNPYPIRNPVGASTPTTWEVLNLPGEYLPSQHSFLIVSHTWNNPNPRLLIENYDILWQDVEFSNRNMSVAIVSNQVPLSPIITEAEMTSVIDLVGAFNEGPPRDRVHNHWGSLPALRLSRQEATRRINFQNTPDNRADFEPIRYAHLSNGGISDALFEVYRPRYRGDGAWPALCDDCGEYPCVCDTTTSAVLMTLTRETATLAEAGNRFNADGGVFSDYSFLTAWDNNERITIGGTGRTPIVINNGALLGIAPDNGWKAASAFGIDDASAFEITFRTTGYENIQFSCRQKSTGSGPDRFRLAYRIGSTGSFIPIDNSTVNPVRVSNDTYAALADTYIGFVLPDAISNQDEVHLRVYFDGLTNLGRNGNTSINNIVITGDPDDGSPRVRFIDAGEGAVGEGVYSDGDFVYIFSGIRPGYVFSHWSAPGGMTLNDRSAVFVMPANALVLTAHWTSAVILRGDADGDGIPNTSNDAALLTRYLLATDKFAFVAANPTFNWNNADVNGDGNITTFDLTLLNLLRS